MLRQWPAVKRYSSAERMDIATRLVALQRAKVLRVWVEAGLCYLDLYRPIYEKPAKRSVSWEDAAKIAEEGKLPSQWR